MNQDLKVRILAAIALVSITSLLLFSKQIPPQVWYYSVFPLLGFVIIFMPMFLGLATAPMFGAKLIRIYENYHKILKHNFKIKDSRKDHKFSRLYTSIISSLYPLGISLKFLEGPVISDEVDMGFITLVVLIQYVITIFSYAIFVISKSKKVIIFDNGESRFNIGEKIREKLNYFSIGPFFLIIFPSIDAFSSSELWFFITLGIALIICFGSNVIGFWIADKYNLFDRAVIHLKRQIKDPDYKPGYL